MKRKGRRLRAWRRKWTSEPKMPLPSQFLVVVLWLQAI